MLQGVRAVSAQTYQKLLDGDRMVIEAGYDYSEATVGMIMQLSEEELQDLAARRKAGTFHLEACNSFIPPMYRIAEGKMRDELRKYVEEAMRRLDMLDIRVVVFGSGFARRFPREMAYETGMEEICNFLRMCNEVAEKYNVTVVIEPLNRRETNCILSVKEGAEIVRKLNLPYVRLLADAYHMFVEKEDLGVLEEEGELLVHTHVAEVPERIWPGAHGGKYLKAFAEHLKKAGYDGRVTAECGFTDFAVELDPAFRFMNAVFKDGKEYKMALTFTAKRDMCQEPVFLAAEELPEVVGSAKTADGSVFPAQKVEGGILILADAKKGETVAVELCEEKAGLGVEIVERPEASALDVKIGGQLFTSYVYAGELKPYLGPIIAGNGDWYTRLDPTIKEHPHHRSVWVAVGDVNGFDFWNEKGNYGAEHHQGFEKIECGNVAACITAKNVWTDLENVPQVDEKRTFTFYAQDAKARYVDVEIVFTASYGDVNFGPTKEAGPLGIRLNEQMRADRGGCFDNSYGAVNEGECWGRAASWCDYHGQIDGKTYGIACFDNEDNERYPTTWHIRNYGLFAPNNFYFKGGFVLKAGESLTYKYRMCFYEDKINTGDRFILYAHNEPNHQ